MKVLMGIILLHLLVIVRAKLTAEDGLPNSSVFFLSLLTVAYVLVMMLTMDMPNP